MFKCQKLPFEQVDKGVCVRALKDPSKLLVSKLLALKWCSPWSPEVTPRDVSVKEVLEEVKVVMEVVVADIFVIKILKVLLVVRKSDVRKVHLLKRYWRSFAAVFC